MVKAAASSSAAAAHAGAAAAPVTSAIPNDGDETMAPAGGEAVEVIPDDSADTPGSDMKGAQPANGKSLSEAEELNPTSTNWTFRPIFTKEHVNKPPRNWVRHTNRANRATTRATA